MVGWVFNIRSHDGISYLKVRNKMQLNIMRRCVLKNITMSCSSKKDGR